MKTSINIVEQKFEEYLSGREPYFYWTEMPKTRIWYDADSNTFKTDIGIDISFDNYDIEDLNKGDYIRVVQIR